MGFFDSLRGRKQPQEFGPAASPSSPADWAKQMRVEMGLEPADPNVGKVDGQHYTACVGNVEELKRHGRLDEAAALLSRLCDAVEAEASAVSHGVVPPWYYEQLAIIFRKQKKPAQEVAILERYARSCGVPEEQSAFAGRLAKARALHFASENEPVSFCPYCGVEISPMPSASRKCPECGEQMIVGKKHGEEIKSLLTVAQAEDTKRIQVEEREYNKVLDRARKLGFNAIEVEQTKRELTERWGSSPSSRDLVWTLSNKAAQKACSQPTCDWASLSRTYQVQGDVLEEEGGSTIEADQRAQDALLHYFEGVFGNMELRPEVLVSSRKNCCPECGRLSGRAFRISDALAAKMLPNPNCTNPRCRCSWRGNYDQ